MTEPIDFFVTGGTLRANDPSYVTRPADHDLLQQLQAGEFCYVLTPRQMGKSSLMVRTAQRLRADGTRVAIVDLTRIGGSSSEVTADQWYLGVLTSVRTQLRLATDVQMWWDEHPALGIAQRFITFLHDVLLAECDEPVAILIDEIDSTLNLGFRDDFFAAIRALYNERATDPIYQRLTFALFGVATPTDLIQDRERTPFNVGRRIDLREFTLDDAQPLHDGLAASFPVQADAILQCIFDWTNGHPYLTQKLCQVIQTEVPTDLEHDVAAVVDEAVQRTFFSEEGRKDPNLTFVQDRIANSPNGEKRRMLQLYRRVQRSDDVADDDRSPAQNRLELYGLVGAAQGRLRVRNRIYARVFDSAWVGSMMPVDRRQRRAVLAGVGALVLAIGVVLFIFLQPEVECSVFSEQFTANEDSSVRLNALASLFNQDNRCRSIALDLFYNLQPEEHEALFLDLNDYPSERERLVTVIDGIYRTLDTVPEHDITLMEIWLNILKNAGVSENDSMVITLVNWKEGRKFYSEGNYAQAVDALSTAVMLDHPVIYYDHALALIATLDYEGALQDLNEIVEIANKAPITPTPATTPTVGVPTPTIQLNASTAFTIDPTQSPIESVEPTVQVSASRISSSTLNPLDSSASNNRLPLHPGDYRKRFNNADRLLAIVDRTLTEHSELAVYLQRNLTNYPNLQAMSLDVLFIDLVQIGPGVTDKAITDSLIFQIEAYDPFVGNRNGDGIDSVDMYLFESDGTLVYNTSELSGPYCFFGDQGENPVCNVWNISANANRWPDGSRVQNDAYTLIAVANASRGITSELEIPVEIHLEQAETLDSSPTDLVVNLVQTSTERRK